MKLNDSLRLAAENVNDGNRYLNFTLVLTMFEVGVFVWDSYTADDSRSRQFKRVQYKCLTR